MTNPATRAALAGFRAAGEAAQYSADGGTAPPVSTWAALERRAEPVSYESSAVERRVSLHLLAADVGAPARGDTVTVSGTTYELQDLQADDGLIVKFSARLT